MTPFARTSLASLSILAVLAACEFSRQLGDEDTATDGATGETASTAFDDAAAMMAAAACAASIACDCALLFPDKPRLTQAQCVDALGSSFENMFAEGQEKGLTYDPACVAQYVAYYEDRGCDPIGPASDVAWFEVMHCPLFHGDLPVGSACNRSRISVPPQGTECALGLECIWGTCEAVKPDGELCETPGLPAREGDCEYGSYCDHSAPPRCLPLRAAGESCDEDRPCRHDSVCVDQMCVTALAPGESCASLPACGYVGVCDPVAATCVGVPSACEPLPSAPFADCVEPRFTVGRFIADNDDCVVDQDCVVVDAGCYADPGNCDSVTLNAGYDQDAWTQLMTHLSQECTNCDADPCGASPVCTDGVCTL
jgi:hypothetical protein